MKRSKHIKIRYFFIKNKIELGEVSLSHSPRDELTKPMKEKSFREMQAQLINFAVNYTDDMIDNVTDSRFQKLQGNVKDMKL